MTRIVMPFIGESDRQAIVTKSPQFFDQAILEFPDPLSLEKGAYGLSPHQELGPVSPNGIVRIGLHNAIRVTRVPDIFGQSYLQKGRVFGKGWNGCLYPHNIYSSGLNTLSRQFCLLNVSLYKEDRSVYHRSMVTPKTASQLYTSKQSARERILLTAHDLFYREGIRGTGIDRIIAESGVTKVTFYRHYPSKNALIEAYLDYRHGQWMDWFQDALKRHGNSVEAIVPALQEWFTKPNFRGCAFINTMGEMGTALPETVQWLQRHKISIRKLIETLLPAGTGRKSTADAIALGIDGAVVRAAGGEVASALKGLSLLIACLDRVYRDRQRE